MLKTGQQHLDSLRDGRKVYIGNEPVEDVTTHPAFRNAAQSFAMIYDRKRDPENVDIMAYEADDGELSSSWFLKPKTKDDLRKRSETHRRVAEWSYGLLGRSPDHVASFVTGLTFRHDLFDDNRKGAGAHLEAYYDDMRRKDTFACYTVLPPQGARQPELYLREGLKVPTLQVTGENADGVILNGMKMLGTSAVFANETWVGNLLPLGEDQAAESVTCAVPLNAPGVTIWTRKPFERYAISEFDSPFSWRFDETDAMVLFEDVRVPWERVFTHNDAPLSREIYFQTPSHIMGNHQSNVRFHEKLKLLLGIAHKSAELNNVLQVPAVRDTLGRLAAGEAALGAMIAGQIEAAEEMVPGFLNVNLRYMYGALHWCTQSYANICEIVRELMGGGPFQMPADVSVIADPALREKFETYWSVPGQSAVERMKFLKLGWDLLGSDFAARHQQYERFYAGPAFINTLYNFLNCPWQNMTDIVDGALASYGTPEIEEVRRPLAAE